MNILKGIGAGLLVIGLIMALSYGFGWFGVGYTKTVGKAQQNAETEVFKQSQSYIDGKNQELSKLQLEYKLAKADDEKAAIKATILHSFAGVDENILSEDLRAFLDKLRSE